MAQIDLAAPWSSLPIVVFDCETTGLPPGAEICELAAVRFEAGEVMCSFRSLVNPGIPIPAEATAVHGITDAQVADAPPLAAVVARLLDVAVDAVPCAFNADFDRRLLHARVTGIDAPLIDPDFPGWLDPLVIARRIDGTRYGRGKYTLGALCARWGVIFDAQAAHTALGDCIATGRLLWAMRNKIKPVPLGRMLEHTEQLRAEDQRRYEEWALRTFRGPNVLRGLVLAAAFALGKASASADDQPDEGTLPSVPDQSDALGLVSSTNAT